jgi:transposase-like protein
MQRNRHSSEFKEQALSKARQRGSRTLESVAGELNLSLGTLKGWLKLSGKHAAGSPHAANLPGDVPARQWSPAQRLLALNQSHTLTGPALHAWCREKGLFEHQLKQWRESFCAAAPAPEQRPANAALRELQGQHEQLQRELRRKDKALAEAAALLVLQKKFQALVLRSELEGEDK